jgi:tetratricopeptide (TPR) repeat protein
MRWTLPGACAALCLIVTPVVLSSQVSGAPVASASSEPTDRLTQERMAELVAGPMAIVERRGLVAGKASFDRALAAMRARHGANSVQVADLLIAFGVGLYNFGMERDDQPIKEAAIPYLEAAIPAYRAAFGDAHPEVAVALNSYADAQSELHRDNPPASVDSAREESYRISSAASGPTSVQALATLRYLAVLKGHPSRTRGDPARIEAAAALFRELISRSPERAEPDYLSATAGRTAFARMYAQNRMANEAREQLRLAIEQVPSRDALDRCIFAEYETRRLETILAGAPVPGASEQCLAQAVEAERNERR